MTYIDSRFYAIKVILYIALLLLSHTFLDPDMMLYPARSQWGTYCGCCSKRDGAQT